MVNQVRIGEEYEWSREDRTDRVIAKDEPFRGDYNASPAPGEGFPQAILKCEVELIADGKREFAPLSELKPVT